MRLILGVLMAAALSPVAARADDRSATTHATPADAVRGYGEAVAERDPAKLARAFQPSAIAYRLEGGAVTATYQAQWKARLAKASEPAISAMTIERIDAGQTTALARVRAIRDGQPFVDYVLLARLSGGWRILATLGQPNAAESPASAAGVAAVVDAKLAADRAWDAARLGETLDPRALVTSVEDGEFVAASVAEWQARYRDRRATSAGATFALISQVVEARGDIGMARWSFRSASGEWTDRALLLKTASGWRMIALLFVKEAPL
ncbi:nuclear transport factor 2 family protein [Caulobacter sp. UNC358MFTsu5.1]|uniref:nuclear transport factor 2 family protein n=1 Tax=Caulobacter sp. UNC358MFTsu5.1 TaxID=1449049 RepID=UPI0004A71540|nr:nuclear transport factor 2 family protein [Caulobacter sp. UNC358MFTsu5.1]